MGADADLWHLIVRGSKAANFKPKMIAIMEINRQVSRDADSRSLSIGRVFSIDLLGH